MKRLKRPRRLLLGWLAAVGMGAVALSASAHEAPLSLEGLPLLEDVAAEAVQISPHVPHMGAHWARESDLPVGPIYCVIEGRVVCIEYMFTMEAFRSGTDWLALAPGIQTPPISHIDLEFKPEGVGPAPVPLYQLHIYFAGLELLEQH